MFMAAYSIDSLSAQDTLEFVGGAKVQGRLVEIKEGEQQIIFEVVVGTAQTEANVRDEQNLGRYREWATARVEHSFGISDGGGRVAWADCRRR